MTPAFVFGEPHVSESSAAVADAPGETTVEPVRKKKSERKKKPRHTPRYHVILWNDDDHSYGYVERMLVELFGHTREHSHQLAEEVDKQGRAIVLTTTLEHAELKRDQIHAYGKDDIKGCKGSMTSTIEPAPE